MAHVSYHVGTSGKANKTEVSKQQEHTYRKEEERNKPHSNKGINEDLTKYNFEKTIDNKTIKELSDERIDKDYNGKRAPQKNHIITREAISQLNSDYYEGMSFDEKRVTALNFSEDAHEWYQNEFGEDNVLGYAVHLDEMNPHTHFTIMPMTDDGRLSQKEFWKGPSDLKRQHREFREHMIDKGWDIELENANAGKLVDYDIDVFKRDGYEIKEARNSKNEIKSKLHEDIIANTDVRGFLDSDIANETFDYLIDQASELLNNTLDENNAQNKAIHEEYEIMLGNIPKREKDLTEGKLELNRDRLVVDSDKQDVIDDKAHLKREEEDFEEYRSREIGIIERREAKNIENETKNETERGKINIKNMKYDDTLKVAEAVVLTVLEHDPSKIKTYNAVKEHGINNLNHENQQRLIRITKGSFNKIITGERDAHQVNTDISHHIEDDNEPEL